MKASELKKAEKLKNILAAAQQIFAEKGFHKTTIDEIAESAQVAKGTVYLYFPDKKALFEHILNGLLDEYIDSFQKLIQLEDPLQGLKEFIELRLKVYSENANFVRINLQGNFLDEETKFFLLKMHKYHLEIAQEIIQKGIAKNIFACKNVLSAGIALNGMINQFALYNILVSSMIDIEQNTAEITEIFYKGIKV